MAFKLPVVISTTTLLLLCRYTWRSVSISAKNTEAVAGFTKWTSKFEPNFFPFLLSFLSGLSGVTLGGLSSIPSASFTGDWGCSKCITNRLLLNIYLRLVHCNLSILLSSFLFNLVVFQLHWTAASCCCSGGRSKGSIPGYCFIVILSASSVFSMSRPRRLRHEQHVVPTRLAGGYFRVHSFKSSILNNGPAA